MKIFEKKLRQIIREELTRRPLREQGLDFDLDDESGSDRALDAYRKRQEEIERELQALDTPITPEEKAAFLASRDRSPEPERPEFSASPMASIGLVVQQMGAARPDLDFVLRNMDVVIPELDAVYNGQKIMKRGDRGIAVKIVQILMKVFTPRLIGVLEPMKSSIYLGEQAKDAIADLTSSAAVFNPDGVFGDKTEDMVEAIQRGHEVIIAMIELTTGAPKGAIFGPAGRGVTAGVKVDGKIGRQTLQFLMAVKGQEITGKVNMSDLPYMVDQQLRAEQEGGYDAAMRRKADIQIAPIEMEKPPPVSTGSGIRIDTPRIPYDPMQESSRRGRRR